MKDKDVFVADDMIASGHSILDVARQLKKRGANRVYCAATFGLFTSGLGAFDRAYQDHILDGVYATDLTWLPHEVQDRPWFHKVEMSQCAATVIAALNHNESVQMSTDLWHSVKKLVQEVKHHPLDSDTPMV